MSTMTHDDIAQLDREIARALGAEWTAELKRLYDWQSGFSIIGHADGPALHTQHDRGRLTIRGEQPPGDRNRHNGSPPPSISMAISRGPAVIAREIQRRYLPLYLAWYTHAVTQDASYDRAKAARVATLQILAGILGETADGDGAIYHSGKEFYTTFDVHYADCADIKISNAPVELAEAVLRLIHEYEISHAEEQSA